MRISLKHKATDANINLVRLKARHVFYIFKDLTLQFTAYIVYIHAVFHFLHPSLKSADRSQFYKQADI